MKSYKNHLLRNIGNIVFFVAAIILSIVTPIVDAIVMGEFSPSTLIFLPVLIVFLIGNYITWKKLL